MDFFELLGQVCVPNRDNGQNFTDTQRIERISTLLWQTKYRRVNPEGLFCLYAARPLEEISNPILISSHIDCVNQMSTLFSRDHGNGLILGTYDNSITNAAVLTLMCDGLLPDNVLVAFTGDEEQRSRGADQLIRFLSARGKRPLVTIILDVTDMGWEDQADFTIENNFWDEPLGRRIIDCAGDSGGRWKFVPSDKDVIPGYVNSSLVIAEDAEADESWEYEEHNCPCFSFCLPIFGPMHSSAGVLARKDGCRVYLEALEKMAHQLASYPGSD